MDKRLYLLAELDNASQLILRGYESLILQNGLSGEQTKDIPYHITLGSWSCDYEQHLVDLFDGLYNYFPEIPITRL